MKNEIAKYFGYAPQEKVKQALKVGRMIGQRSFAAAEFTRLTGDLSKLETQIDQDIRTQGNALRARARNLTLNNKYGRRALQLYVSNVVGPLGHTFDSNVSRQQKDELTGEKEFVPDESVNTQIIELFNEWKKPEFCSVDQRTNFNALCKLIAAYRFRDGEIFIRRTFDKKSKFGLRLQILPPEMIDDTYTEILSGGNVVIMGVELDMSRKPVAYWIREIDQSSMLWGISPYTGEHKRIPASEIIHWYDPEFANQTRGFTKLAAALLPLHQIERYEKASLNNAAFAASKGGFFSNKPGADADNLTGDDTDTRGNIMIDGDSLIFSDIGDKEFKPWDPTYPTAQHEMFVRTSLKGAASALGMAYSSLANDYSNANYSSNRAELSIERRMWKTEQYSMVDVVEMQIFNWWIIDSIICKTLPTEWLNNLSHYNKPIFIPPGWQWVDPKNELDSINAGIASGQVSPFDSVSETGHNLEQIYRDIAEAQKLAKKYNIEIDYGTKKATAPAQDASQDESQDTTPTGDLLTVDNSSNGNGKGKNGKQ
jgi:lambda family phage portal protein